MPNFIHEFPRHLKIILQMHLPPFLIKDHRLKHEYRLNKNITGEQSEPDLVIPFAVEVRIALVAPDVGVGV